MKLLLSPHNDDEALFASYICLSERPKVIVCLNGGRKRHYPLPETRAAESSAAMEILGCDFEHLYFQCDPAEWDLVEARLADEEAPERVWAPLPEPNGHRHHNRLAAIALKLWPGLVSFYSTYRVINDWPIKSTHGSRVHEQPGWAELKREALDCYATQIASKGTRMHFEQPLDEYGADTLRLNLGGGINPLDGFVNLDKSNGWMFEDGLEPFPDDSVEAITVSHALMYVPLEQWPFVFSEMARVLQPGATIRITEDAIGCPGSARPVIRPRATVATTPELLAEYLDAVGLNPQLCAPHETGFSDDSLIQQNYGDPPDVFHIEGAKRALRRFTHERRRR